MTQLININDLKLLKYIQLKDCNDFKFKNILLVINENEFGQLSQDDICKILAINCLKNKNINFNCFISKKLKNIIKLANE